MQKLVLDNEQDADKEKEKFQRKSITIIRAGIMHSKFVEVKIDNGENVSSLGLTKRDVANLIAFLQTGRWQADSRSSCRNQSLCKTNLLCVSFNNLLLVHLRRYIGFYMKTCYPLAIYRFDFGAGAWLSNNFRLMGLQKAIQMNEWKHPDFTLYEPAMIDGTIYNGMCLELKPEGEKIYKKDGGFVSEHVEKQDYALGQLRQRGYMSQFVIGISAFQQVIDSYLSYTEHQKKIKVKFASQKPFKPFGGGRQK